MIARFEGRIVLVTGGSRGQGAEEVRRLVAERALVVFGDLLDEEGRALAQELGGRAVFRHHDVTNEESWNGIISEAERLGGLHGLVNNAGIYRPTAIPDTETDSFEQHFRVNQLGCFLGLKLCAPLLARSGGGSIVNISSIAGLVASPNAIAYGSTKWALRGMTKTAAVELAQHDIRVNSVHPGLIDTVMLGIRERAELDRRVATIPLKRMGTSEDVAKLVLFLLSDDSSYITGAEIAVDGGLIL